MTIYSDFDRFPFVEIKVGKISSDWKSKIPVFNYKIHRNFFVNLFQKIWTKCQIISFSSLPQMSCRKSLLQLNLFDCVALSLLKLSKCNLLVNDLKLLNLFAVLGGVCSLWGSASGCCTVDFGADWCDQTTHRSLFTTIDHMYLGWR